MERELRNMFEKPPVLLARSRQGWGGGGVGKCLNAAEENKGSDLVGVWLVGFWGRER